MTRWAIDEQDPEFQRRLAESLAQWGKDEEDKLVLVEIEEHFAAVMEDEPDYDWGPDGPPR